MSYKSKVRENLDPPRARFAILTRRKTKSKFELNFINLIRNIPKKTTLKNKVEQLVREAEKLIEIEDYQNAEILLNQVLEENPNNAEGHYLLGETLCKKENFSSAVDHLRKALLLLPEHPRILHLLGWVTFMNGDPDSGRKFMLLSLEKLPEVQTYCDLAVLENGQGNFEKAMEYALKAREIEPDSQMVQEVIEAIRYFKMLREQLTDKMN